VRNVRVLVLTSLAWLLPVMSLIAVAFLLALPFAGHDRIWSAHHAAMFLLSSAGALGVLINAAYQDGRAEAPIARISLVVAVAALVVLNALAACALIARARQYGWTPNRVFAGAGVVVAACYSIGYTRACLSASLRGLESTNVATSLVV